jgi:hypothetical protein
MAQQRMVTQVSESASFLIGFSYLRLLQYSDIQVISGIIHDDLPIRFHSLAWQNVY